MDCYHVNPFLITWCSSQVRTCSRVKFFTQWITPGSFVVFDISSKSFSNPLFPISISARECQQVKEEWRKNSKSNFSKRLSCRKAFELKEYYSHSWHKKCQSKVLSFSNCNKKYLIFQSIWGLMDLLLFYVKFLFALSANIFQSITKARLQLM